MNAPHLRCLGHAIIEFALVLPLLLFLCLSVFDYSRAIHANNILVNMSREGANLASRSAEAPLYIMKALATTAEPLDMAAHGALFITRITGLKDGANIEPVVQAQHHWPLAGGYASARSQVWGGCASWNGADGSCSAIGAGTLAQVPVALKDGETVYAVEAFYDYDAVFGELDLGLGAVIPRVGPELYSLALF